MYKVVSCVNSRLEQLIIDYAKILRDGPVFESYSILNIKNNIERLSLEMKERCIGHAWTRVHFNLCCSMLPNVEKIETSQDEIEGFVRDINACKTIGSGVKVLLVEMLRLPEVLHG